MSKIYETILLKTIEKLPALLPLIYSTIKKAYHQGAREKIKEKIDPDNDKSIDDAVLMVLDIIFDFDEIEDE